MQAAGAGDAVGAAGVEAGAEDGAAEAGADGDSEADADADAEAEAEGEAVPDASPPPDPHPARAVPDRASSASSDSVLREADTRTGVLMLSLFTPPPGGSNRPARWDGTTWNRYGPGRPDGPPPGRWHSTDLAGVRSGSRLPDRWHPASFWPGGVPAG